MSFNTAIHAGQSATNPTDTRVLRCDTSGRLLVGSSGSGIAYQGTLITTAPAYTANDNVGGEISLAAPLLGEVAPSVAYRLDSLAMVDPAAQSANLLVMFFAASPVVAGATVVDNAAFAWSAGARAAFLGHVEVPTANWKTVIAGNQIVTIPNINLMLKADASNLLWAVVFAVGTPNFGNGFLYLKLGLSRMG